MFKNEFRWNEIVVPIVAPQQQRIHNAFQFIPSVGPEQMQFQNWNIYFANHRHYLEEIKDDED